jgi:hypothetical protein
MIDDDRLKNLEARIAALETAPAVTTAPALHPAWPLGLGLAALVLGYLGLGLPQHYYQPLFAGLFLLLAYHRGFFRLYPQPWRWPLVVLNFLLLLMVFKLLLGGGLSYPFEWLKVPTLQQLPPTDDSWAQKYIPRFQMVWEGVPGVSDWTINITRFQSMLLIATLIGALFRFQPFASLTALALLVISFPSYLAFNWDYVVLFLVIGGAAIYLQSTPQHS